MTIFDLGIHTKNDNKLLCWIKSLMTTTLVPWTIVFEVLGNSKVRKDSLLRQNMILDCD